MGAKGRVRPVRAHLNLHRWAVPIRLRIQTRRRMRPDLSRTRESRAKANPPRASRVRVARDSLPTAPPPHLHRVGKGNRETPRRSRDNPAAKEAVEARWGHSLWGPGSW